MTFEELLAIDKMSKAEVIGITAIATGLVNYIFFWNVGLCGASGVAFAFIILASFTGFKEEEIPLTFILVAVIGYLMNKKSKYGY